MSNLNTVQEIYAAFGRGDVPAILDQLADDVAWESWADNSAQAAGVAWLAPGTGKEAGVAYFEIIGAGTFHDFQVLSFMDGGDQIAVEIVVDVENLAGGARFKDEEIHLWTFNDEGLVSRFRHYADTAKHIAAAGGA